MSGPWRGRPARGGGGSRVAGRETWGGRRAPVAAGRDVCGVSGHERRVPGGLAPRGRPEGNGGTAR